MNCYPSEGIAFTREYHIHTHTHTNAYKHMPSAFDKKSENEKDLAL